MHPKILPDGGMPSDGTSRVARLRCAKCQRPERTCICRWVVPTVHCVEVLILQHPLEVDNAKGSARLLQLCLQHSHMVTGEVFAPALLQDLLSAPLPHRERAGRPRRTMLLYPDTPHDTVLDLAPSPPAIPPDDWGDPAQLRLVVLDGTWRKSRKMLYLNPLLQQLPRLSLQDMPASRYQIRKAHRADQLSTLEATCAALAQLERQDERFQPLLAAFDGFVNQQLGYRGQ